jgi:ATP-binding cassette, subfamily B, bacterial
VRIWRAFSRLIDRSGHLAALGLCLSIAQALALVPIALLVRTAFDDAIPSGNSGQLIALGAGILGLYLLSLGLGLAGRYAVLRVTKPSVAKVRLELLDHVIWLPSSFYDSTDSGRLHSLIVQDTERLDTMAKYLLAIVIPSLGTAVLLLFSLVVIQPVLLAILVVAIPLLLGLSRVLRGPLQRRVRTWQEASDSFSASVLAALRSATLIKVRTAEEQAIEDGAAKAAALAAAGQRVSWVQQAYTLIQVALGGVAGVIVLIGGGLAVLHGSISTGDLIAFMAILGIARGQLNWVSATLPDVLNGLAAIERIDEVLARTDAEPYQGKRSIALCGGLAWEGVTFGYSREGPAVLDDISLTVEPGEALAILGPTGAGKTTLIALLLGLYRPWSGTIRIDGEPLEEIDVRGLRRQAGALLQEGGAMRGTVAENISFGRPDTPRREAERAAMLAAAAEFIDELPSGYETEVGDDGVRLSAGQRQRISLARALLGSPPLLMLDEPTSHLDPDTADLVLDNLMGIEPRPTLLLVTHDPLVAARADRVVEVRGGQVRAALQPGGLRSGASAAPERRNSGAAQPG